MDELTEEIKYRDDDEGVDPTEQCPAQRNELGEMKILLGSNLILQIGEKRIRVGTEEPCERSGIGMGGRVVHRGFGAERLQIIVVVEFL